MNRLYLILLAIAASALAPSAMALTIVNTSAPQVNYVFSTDGTVTVTDMSSPIFGGGFLQSRIYQGEPGSPAAGKWVYEYRLDLRYANTAVEMPWATSVALSTGPVLSFDYNFDNVATDQVFVTTAGGLGTIGLQSASSAFNYTTFKFSQTVWAGSTSYFWGYTSNFPPHVVTATLTTSNGNIMLNAYAPKW